MLFKKAEERSGDVHGFNIGELILLNFEPDGLNNKEFRIIKRKDHGTGLAYLLNDNEGKEPREGGSQSRINEYFHNSYIKKLNKHI